VTVVTVGFLAAGRQITKFCCWQIDEKAPSSYEGPGKRARAVWDLPTTRTAGKRESPPIVT